MLKSGSSWNLVPFPASSTKGGKRGVLKALGLDQEEGQRSQLLGFASKLTNKLASSHSEAFWVLGQATGNTDSLDSPWPGFGGKPPPSPIQYSLHFHTGPTSEWLVVPGLPRRSPETVMVWTPKTLGAHNSQLRPPIGMRFKANLQISSRAFQRCVALHLHTLESDRFPTFSGRESNWQFDSRSFFRP